MPSRDNNKRGFGAMDPEKQRELASKGSQSVPVTEKREIGRKSGESRSKNR